MKITDKDRLQFIEKDVMRLDYNKEGIHRLKTTMQPNHYFRCLLFYGESFEEAIDNAIMAMREKERCSRI